MKRKINNKGFTLIEILAAMVLLSIVAFPLVKTFLDGFKFQARSQIKTEANKVIEYVAEQLKNESYSELPHIQEINIKKWAKGESSTLDEFVINDLPGSNLTAPYTVTIDKISSKEVKGDEGGAQVGGISTPDYYELRIRLRNEDGEIRDSYEGRGTHLDTTYTDGILNIERLSAPINEDEGGKFYAIFMDNQTDSPITINVKKNFEDIVQIYTKGEITLNQVADPNLTRAQKFFKQVPLGNNDKIEDRKEYLCEATITAENNDDPSIKSSMNVTFSVFVENEG